MSCSRSLSSCLSVGAVAVVALVGCESPTLDAWPATLEIRAGNFQSGLVGYAVNDPPAVQLLDADGEPVSGAKITFTVTAGGGSITGGVATTGSDGIAAVGSWTVTAGANRLVASIPAPFRVAPVSFSTTGVAPAYQVTLSYLTAVSPGRRTVFDSAAARWQRLIYGDLPDITVTDVPAGACLGNEPPINQTIDDLLIFVTLDSIDGPGAILGAAGPCFIRTAGKLPLVGVMLFDTADVATLEQNGLFDEIIVHEMGHVLGFGSLWSTGLLNLLVGGGGSDPYFSGTNGRATFDRSGGSGYAAGPKVPVENVGGPGTRDSHWRESVFGTELMTGFLSAGGANPLSVVTVASMRDEGYLVNYAAADAYALSLAAPRAPAAPGAPPIALGDDVLRLPIYLVDQRGNLTGVYRPEAP